MKPLLVGEANPYGADPAFALYPLPERASGWRLATLVMGVEPREYLRRFDRVNLCPQRWSKPLAEFSAQRIMAGDARVVVMLGAKVTRAFRLEYLPFTMTCDSDFLSGKKYVCLPHPSGLCRAWNAPGAFEAARGVLRSSGALA